MSVPRRLSSSCDVTCSSNVCPLTLSPSRSLPPLFLPPFSLPLNFSLFHSLFLSHFSSFLSSLAPVFLLPVYLSISLSLCSSLYSSLFSLSSSLSVVTKLWWHYFCCCCLTDSYTYASAGWQHNRRYLDLQYVCSWHLTGLLTTTKPCIYSCDDFQVSLRVYRLGTVPGPLSDCRGNDLISEITAPHHNDLLVPTASSFWLARTSLTLFLADVTLYLL